MFLNTIGLPVWMKDTQKWTEDKKTFLALLPGVIIDLFIIYEVVDNANTVVSTLKESKITYNMTSSLFS